MSSGKNRVTFLPPTTFYLTENQDWKEYRRENWTSATTDRFRFLDRVKKLENILIPQIKTVKKWTILSDLTTSD